MASPSPRFTPLHHGNHITKNNNMASAAAMSVSASRDRLSTLIPELRNEIFRLAIAPEKPFTGKGPRDDNFNITSKVHPLAQVSRQLRREVLPLLFGGTPFGWAVENQSHSELKREEHREHTARNLHRWLLSFGEGLRFVPFLAIMMPPINFFPGELTPARNRNRRTFYRLGIVIRPTSIKAFLGTATDNEPPRMEIGHLSEAEVVAGAMQGVGDIIKGHFAKWDRELQDESGEMDEEEVRRFGMNVDKKLSRQQYIGALVADYGLIREKPDGDADDIPWEENRQRRWEAKMCKLWDDL